MTDIFESSYPVDVSFTDTRTGNKFSTSAEVEVSFLPGELDSEMVHIQIPFSELLHGIENVKKAEQMTTDAVLINFADTVGDLDDPLL